MRVKYTLISYFELSEVTLTGETYPLLSKKRNLSYEMFPKYTKCLVVEYWQQIEKNKTVND